MSQEWNWKSETHYTTAMVVEEDRGGDWAEVLRTHAEFYAISIDRLLDHMRAAGLEAELIEDVSFFQPVLRGRAG